MPMNRDELERLRLRLQQGGVRSENAVTYHVAAKMILALGGVGAFLWMNAMRAHRIEPAFVIAVLVFASGFYLPEIRLSSRIASRQTFIERGLPDALDLLVTCVEAGLGLDAAIQRVSDEVRIAWPLLGDELRVTFLEVKAGIPRVESFRRLAARTGVRELKSLSATLTQTEIFGTSVALALRIQAEGIRVRRMQRAEEKAAYVSVKMTVPLILCILPSLFAIILGPAALNIAKTLMPMMGGSR
jgi:tight adherence protein C